MLHVRWVKLLRQTCASFFSLSWRCLLNCQDVVSLSSKTNVKFCFGRLEDSFQSPVTSRACVDLYYILPVSNILWFAS